MQAGPESKALAPRGPRLSRPRAPLALAPTLDSRVQTQAAVRTFCSQGEAVLGPAGGAVMDKSRIHPLHNDGSLARSQHNCQYLVQLLHPLVKAVQEDFPQRKQIH